MSGVAVKPIVMLGKAPKDYDVARKKWWQRRLIEVYTPLFSRALINGH